MNLLTMEHITKSYTDRVLLDDVGLGINENEKIITYFKDILDMFKEIKYTEYTKDSNNFSKNNLQFLQLHILKYQLL